MREVAQKDYTFSNDAYISVFVGVCKSQELLNQYMDKDYDLLNEYDCIGFEMGVDFNINTYDEDFLVFVINPKMSNDIEEVFADATVFDINLLKKDYPDGLDRPYNAAIVIGGLKYEGEVKEIQNDEFGYFKFLGVYPDED
ncbi:MAG: immunity 22 family protein [Lachnospiraceae bacterium]|nr:immunity 22 family protein [Lachnospiraceae bacterium]